MGGGIHVFNGADLIVENSLFRDNTAVSGAAVSVAGASARLIHDTLLDNTATSNGATIFSDASSTLDLHNSIVWGNVGGSITAAGVVAVTYSDIEGGFAGAGNIDQDPDLVFMGGWPNLRATSPCINAGSLTNSTGQDAVGEPRPTEAFPDMGTDEWVDSDNDGMSDEFEQGSGVDDPNADPDGDGRTNLQEYNDGTNPNQSEDPNDFDGDGMDNAWEIVNGLDLNDSSDANNDDDNDGVNNLQEYTNGTNPQVPEYRVTNLSGGLTVVRADNPSIDVTQVGQTGVVEVIIGDGSGEYAGVLTITFTTHVDLNGVVAEIDRPNGKGVLHNSSSVAAVTARSLLVPRVDDDSVVYVCPDATHH